MNALFVLYLSFFVASGTTLIGPKRETAASFVSSSSGTSLTDPFFRRLRGKVSHPPRLSVTNVRAVGDFAWGDPKDQRAGEKDTRASALRNFFASLLTSTAAASVPAFLLTAKPETAEADPVFFGGSSGYKQLRNRYFLMRAAETNVEAAHILFSNPAKKGPIEGNFITETGLRQALAATDYLAQKEFCVKNDIGNGGVECFVYYNISQRSGASAEVVKEQFILDRTHVVPDYLYFDPRKYGIYNEQSEKYLDEIHKNDAIDVRWQPLGSKEVSGESVIDVMVRARQLLSIINTQIQGADVLIISPDSDMLSITEAMLRGDGEQSLKQHAQYAYTPGEVREISFISSKGKKRSFLPAGSSDPDEGRLYKRL
uniref:Uncharacterized protein n=1 Tax=Chromera velia CCMP2878 TaxID=1169474 RepID=A0A0G4GLS3_9ALVE|eukprot:Cvel_22450.t1-p1 / transcript=Cvel_22450.t1 / gene=Cvel_22450 / organism=Chromera_velia_CCMP2878 / gene_product=hypothetical protein / transcript_product=hypothetical protein / location=Cvel_scaffold2207:2436-6763(-) / protein_length=370 / sequence_SO=supercontig / SO=protein_coding / is_pseudo=false